MTSAILERPSTRWADKPSTKVIPRCEHCGRRCEAQVAIRWPDDPRRVLICLGCLADLNGAGTPYIRE